MGVTEPTLVSLVDSKVEAFVKDTTTSEQGSVLLRWFEKRLKKAASGWFASSAPVSEPEPFEEWHLNLAIRKGATDRGKATGALL